MRAPFEAPRHAALWEQVLPTVPLDEVAHDRWHIERVYRWAVHLAQQHGASPDLAGAAALVHDLVPIPKDHPDRALGGERSAAAAGPLLAAAGYSEAEQATVLDAVATSSWSRGLAPNSLVGGVLQDADRLDAIGAIGAARCFATSQHMAPRGGGRASLVHPGDPAAVSDRPLDDRLYALDHFRRKLLRLAETMHTATAQREAARRHAALLAIVDAMAADVAPPGVIGA